MNFRVQNGRPTGGAAMAKKTGTTKKTETFTTRMEPREKYLLELLARISGRSIAKTLEAAVQQAAKETSMNIRGRSEITAAEMFGVLWFPQEWKRILWLAGLAPHLLTYDESCKLEILSQSPAICSNVSRDNSGAVTQITIRPRLAELAWPLIVELSERMAEGLPAPAPTLKEIEQACGEPLSADQDHAMTMDFTNFQRGALGRHAEESEHRSDK